MPPKVTEFFNEVKGFFHSLTTQDHYAAYESSNDEQQQHSTSTHFTNESSASITMLDNTSSTSLSSASKRNSSRTSLSANKPVQYRPGLRSQLSNNPQPQSDIQLQDYVEGQPPLPSLTSVWDRLEDWLDREFPELGDDLEDGVTQNDLNAIERDLKLSLPLDVRESYQIHDGQLQLGKKRGLIYGYPLLDLEAIAAETNIWRRVADKLQNAADSTFHQPSSPALPSRQGTSKSNTENQKHNTVNFLDLQKSFPPGAVVPVYYHPNWIPIVKDNEGNNIALDLNPGPRGRWGQVILFGRDFDTKLVVASCFTEFLLNLVEDLEEGHFSIDEVDEDLVFVQNGRATSYFEVLRTRAVALAKAHMKRNPEVYGSHIDSNPELVNANTTASRVSLPRETLISPIGSTTSLPLQTHVASSASQLRSSQYGSKAATNDSFVLEDDDDKDEIVPAAKKDILIPSEDVIKPEEDADEEPEKEKEDEVSATADKFNEVSLSTETELEKESETTDETELEKEAETSDAKVEEEVAADADVVEEPEPESEVTESSQDVAEPILA